MDPTATTPPIVTVSASLDGRTQEVSISVTIALPRLDMSARANAHSLNAVREAVAAEVAADSAVQRYGVLAQQVNAGIDVLNAAERTEIRVAAAKKLLEHEPETDLANKLRKVTAELDAAREARAVAQRDLSLLQPLVPARWVEAANVSASLIHRAAYAHYERLADATSAADAALTEATNRVRDTITAAVQEGLLPAALAALALRIARDAHRALAPSVAESVLTGAIGPMPAGVRPCAQTKYFEADATPCAPCGRAA
jgi:hypothetical protein